MNRIDAKFQELKLNKEKALVCFLACGDPKLKTTEELVIEIAEAGADIIELGIPFSDPLADGPSIQAANMRALESGATLAKCFETVSNIRKRCEVPLIFMSCFNPINKYGVARFAQDAKISGIDGIILTDLPPEESAEWKSEADKAELSTIFLLAPTSTDERIKNGTQVTSGFIYCVSRTGVTGARSDVPAELPALISKIKSFTSKPVVIGFGISTPEHVAKVSSFADGAVVGSALVNLVREKLDYGLSEAETVKAAGVFVKELKQATK